MHRNKVLFPEPEGPMMQITCPDVTCKFALSTASMSPKCFVTLITSITTLAFAAIMSPRSEEHTSELQSLMRISYAVFCLKKTKKQYTNNMHHLKYQHTHQKYNQLN